MSEGLGIDHKGIIKLIVVLLVTLISFKWIMESGRKPLDDARFDTENRPQNISSGSVAGDEYSSYFAICSMVKDEPDLREWVSYHHLMGAGKIYIHDDFSAHPLIDQVHDFIKRGIVEYVYDGGDRRLKQNAVYEKCINLHGKKHKFMAFIDGDEFIAVQKPGTSIPTVLKKYEKYGGLQLSWVNYGSSGHIKRPEGGILKNYHMCWRGSNLTKTIANMAHVRGPGRNRHVMKYSDDYYAVDIAENKIVPSYLNMHGAQSPSNEASFRVMSIYHYALKSWEEFEAKMKKGSRKSANYFKVRDSLMIKCPILRPPTKVLWTENKTLSQPSGSPV